ncbi:MAG: hypothetical protein ACI4JF_00645 [Oscillospiraceae bacterium]
MFGSTKINILRKAKIPRAAWCRSAVLVSVKNGRGALAHVSETAPNYDDFHSRLMLNGTPIMQGKYTWCPTCCGLLAAGYSIENADCKELRDIRDKINGGYTDINAAAENISPLLGLLGDGLYLVADVTHYPSDGTGRFFYNVPKELTYYDGACDYYWLSGLLTTGDIYPAFLFPTQSAEMINRERVEYYKDILRRDPDSVRGIAYYEKGYFSALLDGHHKAFAAAELGLPLNCITILPVSYYYTDPPYDKNKPADGIAFCNIKIPFEGIRKAQHKKPIWGYNSHRKTEKITPFESPVTGHGFDISCQKYPTAYELAAISAVLGDGENLTAETAEKWLTERETETEEKLTCALRYFLRTDPPQARSLAFKIIRLGGDILPIREAYRTLLSFRDEETEQLFIDYLINADKKSKCYDIVNSYWDK